MVTTREATQTHCQGLLSHSSLVAQTTPSSTPGSDAADHHSPGMPDSPPNPFASPRDYDQSPTSVDHSLLITTVNHLVLKL